MRPDYARQYRELWEGHWWWRSREKYVLGWLERLHRRSDLGRILDVGCGDGLLFDALRRFGDVEGLEPDASLLSNPKWRDRISVEPLDSSFAREETYDLLLMLDVLEHIDDDGEALESAFKALQPGGFLVLTVPALSWLWSQHDEANSHFRRYHSASLRERLASAGFEVEQLHYFFFWTVLPLLARRFLSPAQQGHTEYEIPIPGRLVNRALTRLSLVDHALGRVMRWPVGSSLLAIARRPVGSKRRAVRISSDERLLSDAFAAQ